LALAATRIACDRKDRERSLAPEPRSRTRAKVEGIIAAHVRQSALTNQPSSPEHDPSHYGVEKLASCGEAHIPLVGQILFAPPHAEAASKPRLL